MLLVCLRRTARGLQFRDLQCRWGVNMFEMLVCLSVTSRFSGYVHFIVWLLVDGLGLKGCCTLRSTCLFHLSRCLSARAYPFRKCRVPVDMGRLLAVYFPLESRWHQRMQSLALAMSHNIGGTGVHICCGAGPLEGERRFHCAKCSG